MQPRSRRKAIATITCVNGASMASRIDSPVKVPPPSSSIAWATSSYTCWVQVWTYGLPSRRLVGLGMTRRTSSPSSTVKVSSAGGIVASFRLRDIRQRVVLGAAGRAVDDVIVAPDQAVDVAFAAPGAGIVGRHEVGVRVVMRSLRV